MAALFAEKSGNAIIKSTAKNLISSLDQMVLAKSLGTDDQKAYALSVWMPADRSKLPDDDTMTAYDKLESSVNGDWNSFLKVWFGAVADNKDPPKIEVTEVQNAEHVTEKTPAKITFNVQDKDLEAVYASVGQAVNDHVFNLYGDLFYDSAEPGVQRTEWDGSLIYVSDGTNTSLFPGFFQDTDNNIYTASALYTPPGEKVAYDIVVQYNTETEKFISALDDSGSSPREMTLEAGGKLEFEYLQFDDNKDDYSYAPTGIQLIVGKAGLGDLEAISKQLPVGEYSVLVGATDWAGNDSNEEVKVIIEQSPSRSTWKNQCLASQRDWLSEFAESIDITTENAVLFFHIFGTIAQFERKLIRERTAGLASTRARGGLGGRHQGLDEKLELWRFRYTTMNRIKSRIFVRRWESRD